jgi:N-ethylmaleimide reductase
MTSIFDAGTLGDIRISNRVVMAPMTRSRAAPGGLPDDLHVTYYGQRASAGLIITEGTQPSEAGQGYCRTPGIHSPEQITAWRRVTEAVHARGGAIVLQIMHVGRIASALNKAPGAETVAPSAIRAQGQMFTESGMVDFDLPRALETAEIPGVIEEFAQAARNAREAGFDGVELHCTSGYLPAQFLSTGTNQRNDGYGGSVTNRVRFVLETLEAMASAVGAGRVGFRICPGNPFNDLHDADPRETFGTLLQAASPLGLAYLHLIDLRDKVIDSAGLARQFWTGPKILNESLDLELAQGLLAAGEADAVSFGRHYIANPDLVERFRTGAKLAKFDRTTLYTAGAAGYIDYPAMSQR